MLRVGNECAHWLFDGSNGRVDVITGSKDDYEGMRLLRRFKFRER